MNCDIQNIPNFYERTIKEVIRTKEILQICLSSVCIKFLIKQFHFHFFYLYFNYNFNFLCFSFRLKRKTNYFRQTFIWLKKRLHKRERRQFIGKIIYWNSCGKKEWKRLKERDRERKIFNIPHNPMSKIIYSFNEMIRDEMEFWFH